MLRHVSRWSTGALGNTLLNSRAHTWIHVHTLNSSTLSFHPLNLYVHSVRLDLSLCHSRSVRSTYHQCLESYVIYHNASNITSYNLFYLNYFLFCTLFFALKSVVRGTYNSTYMYMSGQLCDLPIVGWLDETAQLYCHEIYHRLWLYFVLFTVNIAHLVTFSMIKNGPFVALWCLWRVTLSSAVQDVPC